MKVILITGLDGSGKTTFLNRIKDSAKPAACRIINIPHINIQQLKIDKDLYRVALFVNSLNYNADIQNIPQLKAVALFASMLLYGKILALIRQDAVETVFCERHPLIDTGVYARFYAEKLYPGSIEQSVLDRLDKKYESELSYLLNLLPSNSVDIKKGYTSSLIHFIYKLFYLEKKYDTENLKLIFKVSLPDELYFLQASPKLLFNRIKNRKLLEAHESIEVFKQLNKAYNKLFNELESKYAIEIELVNIEEAGAVDNLFAKLIQGIEY